MADRPGGVVEDVEDEYEEDEYEEVFAEEDEGAGAGGDAGVEALDTGDDGNGGDEDEDEDEDDEGLEGGDEYEEEDEDEDEGATQSGEEEEEQQQAGALVAAAAAAGRGAGGDGGDGGAERRDALVRRLKSAANELRPAKLLGTATTQLSRARRLLWRFEDATVFTARLAARLAKRAARPALVALVAHRTLRTLADARLPLNQATRMPRSRQRDYLFTRAMGKDWREVMRRDLLDACADVDEGLVTEEIDFEKRALQAAILRRLEVEEWDKERMRHYYYGLYGLGPWYWDMEERLHNPLFIASRGWNSPIEAWVGRNKIYRRDIADSKVTGDGITDHLRLLGEQRGKAVSVSVAKRVAERETLTRADSLLMDKSIVSALTSNRKGPDGRLLSGAEAALAAREELEAARERRRRERAEEEEKAGAA